LIFGENEGTLKKMTDLYEKVKKLLEQNTKPFLSMFAHESDKYTIVLNRTDDYRQYMKEEQDPCHIGTPEIETDRIVTMPNNHRQVVDYISKYIQERK